MKKTLLAALASLQIAAGAAFAASPAPQLQQQGQDEEQVPVKLQPPTNQNYYVKGGKYFGKSLITKDASGQTVIQYYDSAGRLAGYGRPYIGKQSGNKIVKYYDKSDKYLGYSSTASQPDGGGITTYKLSSGMVLGTSVMKLDPKTGDYVTSYYWSSGKLAGYSRRTPQKPDDAAAAQSEAAAKASTTSSAQAQQTQQAQKAKAAASSAKASNSTASSDSSGSSSGNGDPILVPASKKR